MTCRLKTKIDILSNWQRSGFPKLIILVSGARPGNSAILLETGSIDHNRALSIPSALCVKEKDVNIAQYRALSIPSALRITEKKFPLILVRGSQSYLSWYIVSLLRGGRVPPFPTYMLY